MTAARTACTAVCLFIVSACTINLSPKNFVYQDEQREDLELQSFQNALISKNNSAKISALTIERDNGMVLRGYALQQAQARVNIVFYPGNGMKLNRSFEMAERMAKIPANIVWFDYRGVGVSNSSVEDITIKKLQDDSRAVYDLAKKTLPETLPFVVHGLSMGSLLAVDLMQARSVDALVLDSAIASMPELSERLTPWWAQLFASVVLDQELKSLQMAEAIKQYSGPLLVLVGEEDGMTPVSDSRQLYNSANSSNKTLTIIPEVGHAKPLRSDMALLAYSQLLDSL